MVAISLYRGNLHRVPEGPRRFLSPSPKISLKNFRHLLRRRSSALYRRSNPNPNHPHANSIHIPNPTPLPISKPPEPKPDSPQQQQPLKGTGHDHGLGHDGSGPLPEAPQINDHVAGSCANSLDENPQETTDVDALSDTDKRKKEIKEKLEVLNAKKHDLVQVLKQILNTEEELKRRNSTQDMGLRQAIPLQVDVTNDLGSLSRLTTPRLNSDGNLATDGERGEADETSHHNPLSRHLVQTSSISPSSDSLHRRPAFSVVPHPRGSLGGVVSPSRFAPVGQPPNLPTTVSASGASYVASSPSPAASGGTSTFRDSRQPSPWN